MLANLVPGVALLASGSNGFHGWWQIGRGIFAVAILPLPIVVRKRSPLQQYILTKFFCFIQTRVILYAAVFLPFLCLDPLEQVKSVQGTFSH